MNEKKLNTLAYTLTIIVELIYIYVTNASIDDKTKNELVKLGRSILLLIAIYFCINAFIGLNKDKSNSQYKQLIASILVLIAAFTRITIKSDNITFR